VRRLQRSQRWQFRPVPKGVADTFEVPTDPTPELNYPADGLRIIVKTGRDMQPILAIARIDHATAPAL
jgi:hypothetical protein